MESGFEDLKAVLDAIVDIMKIEFTIWGFTLSFWGIMLWSMVALIVIWIVWEALR